MAQTTMPPWIQVLHRRDPKFVDAYMAQREHILRDGAIPAKYKHLMTMIVDALQTHPDGVATIANRARAAGASEAEIQEAVEITYLFGGTPALVTAVETALEQALSVQLMHGAARPKITQLQPGDELVRQGDFGQDIYLVLDGVIRVERDGTRLAEYGPGAMLGERALLEGGTRTSTLVAVTRCRVASVPAVQLSRSDLAELSTGHRLEEGVRG